MARKLDRSNPVGRMISVKPMKRTDPHFTQDGHNFDADDNYIGPSPGLEEQQKRAEAKKRREKREGAAAKSNDTLDRAAAILGPLDADPNVEAQRENAAAAAAEEGSDE